MKKWGTLVAMALSMFIIVIDTTIMNVSISALVEDLATTVTGVQSAISIYALVMAAFILIGGKLSDIFGKKRIFVIGLVIYAIGTTTASLSQSLGVLIIGWSILEGIGGALMLPNIQTILRDEYEGADLASAYGIVGAVAAIGAAVGPIAGGFFTTYFSWRWAFRTEVLVVLIVLFMVRYIASDMPAARKPKFDYVGAALSIFGWSAIVLGILLAQQYGFFLAKQPFIVLGFEIAPLGLSITPLLVGLGFLLILLLFRWESVQEENGNDALFRPSIFSASGIKSGFASRFMQMAINAGFLYLIPLMLQLSFSFTAMQTGFALMPFSLGVLVAALVGARISSRFYANRLVQIGFLVSAAGLAGVGASIQPDSTASDLVLGTLFGLGTGLIASQIINLVISSAKPEQTAETAGLNGTFEQLGNAIGVALIGTVMLTTLSGNIAQTVNASNVYSQEEKEILLAAVEDGVQLVSNAELNAALEEIDAAPEITEQIIEDYHAARTVAFRAGVALLIFGALLGFVLAFSLPRRKLVATADSVPIDAATASA